MKKFLKGFLFAFEGLRYALRTQINMKVHLIAALLVILLGVYFNISSLDWVLLCIAITLVISFELMNTAIEQLTDLVTKEIHPLAKIAKDTAAAAVLIISLLSIVIGVYVFSKYLVYNFYA